MARGEHNLERRAQRAAELLAGDLPRPGIAGTAYDTAWLAAIPAAEQADDPRFPTTLQWLIEHQHGDGSWGGAIRYDHDRVLSTLAALVPLHRFGRRAADQAAVAAGTRFLWQHGHRLSNEAVEPVGFELLLPALVDRAAAVGIPLPPHLDRYGPQRQEKLRLIPPDALYSPHVTVVHSLEFLGETADLRGLRTAQGQNGAVGNSPAATAFYFMRSADERALGYLRACLQHTGGAMAPVLHPCETFELLWAAYHLFLAGVPARQLLSPTDCAFLTAALQSGGVSLSPTFPIPDADDTAVAALLLNDLGLEVDPLVLRPFVSARTGVFASFPYERHSSVGVNVHVLHALLRLPDYPDRAAMIERVVSYLLDQQLDQLYWIDKWHISPYYATAHVLAVLGELPADQRVALEPRLHQSRAWLRQTQNLDGSWGFYGQPTAEETAYGLLALATAGPAVTPDDRQRCALAARYLRQQLAVDAPLPPLWIDKCLYTPTLVVQAVLQSALIANAQLRTFGAIRPQPGRLVA